MDGQLPHYKFLSISDLAIKDISQLPTTLYFMLYREVKQNNNNNIYFSKSLHEQTGQVACMEMDL